MQKFKHLFLIIIFILTAAPVLGQEEMHHETKADVPELSEFHKVIYKIWHMGWPEKDISLLKSLTPEVEKGYENIAAAELPGILRDKKPKWDENVKQFGSLAEEYKNAAENNDSTALLDAAEELHAQFEVLFRIIRPVLKEVDEFHKVLYMLYHYYLPEYDYEKIKESVTNLMLKYEELAKVELPERLNSKREKFTEAVTDLGRSLEILKKEVDESQSKEKITSAIENMHSKYQALESVFD